MGRASYVRVVGVARDSDAAGGALARVGSGMVGCTRRCIHRRSLRDCSTDQYGRYGTRFRAGTSTMTLKALALMPRRPDLTREQFRRYYESRHTPLALRYLRFRKYVRNHLLDAPDIGFDCVSEFWPSAGGGDVRAHADEGGRTPTRGRAPSSPISRASSQAPCEEVHPRRRAAPGRRDRHHQAGAPAADGPSTPATLVGSLQAWAADMAAPGADASRSISLIGAPPAAFPCDAILWLHGVDAGADPRLPAGDRDRRPGADASRGIARGRAGSWPGPRRSNSERRWLGSRSGRSANRSGSGAVTTRATADATAQT